ncbi:hypothetical protein [Bacillus sp. CGMCC 1.16541]|nr:hypothetical protein [Bacillus sp. CGMCC 1.16541]
MLLFSLFKSTKKDCCELEIIEVKQEKSTCCSTDKNKKGSDNA